ncbi:MAG: hypothetical protein JW866_02445 [Ignavibacteriales bacterium]|nr:hypothetical protein [Ignavibacteriales bacterium]
MHLKLNQLLSKEWGAPNTSVAGAKLKSTSGWNYFNSYSGNGTDEYGFTVLPGGYCNADSTFCGRLGDWADFMSSTEAYSVYVWYWGCGYYHSEFSRTYGSKAAGRSVRLVRD